MLRLSEAEDTFIRMERHRSDLLVFSRVPLLAIKLDFGQFRHADRVKPAGAITIVD